MTSSFVERVTGRTEEHDQEAQPLMPSKSSSRKGAARGSHIHMGATIYSSILFAPAVARIKTFEGIAKAHTGRATATICGLIVLNMVLQLGLLRVMNFYRHADSKQNFLHREGSYDTMHLESAFLFLTPNEEKMIAEAKVDPVCQIRADGNYSCIPQSIEHAADWNVLDSNGDGVWDFDEAVNTSKINSAASDHVVLFNAIADGLKHRAKWLADQNRMLYLSPNLKASEAIPKAYFDYWRGDAMFCTRFESAACEKIVASDFFHTALHQGRLAAAHKGIVDVLSARDYCQMMLSGGCEQSLPNSYRTSVLKRKTMCGKMSLRNGRTIVDPRNEAQTFTVVEPDYENLQKQENCASGTFTVFLVLILLLFYASLVDEIRDILLTVDFLVSFPSTENENDPGGRDVGKGDPDKKRFSIERISPKHRMALACVTLLRLNIVFTILSFGSWFLLTEDSYMELVLNAVALSFITSIDETIYEIFLDEHMKEHDVAVDNVEPMHFEGIMPLSHDKTWGFFFFRRDTWGLYFIPIISTLVVLYWTYFVTEPFVSALKCACLQEGAMCSESTANQAVWWEHYWSHTLPAAVHQIEALRLNA